MVAVGRAVGFLAISQKVRHTDETTVESTSIDSFPFVGDIPNRSGHFVTAGFSGHGT